jgi:iron(III) transport system permease protein
MTDWPPCRELFPILALRLPREVPAMKPAGRRFAGKSWFFMGLLAAYLLIFLVLPVGTLLNNAVFFSEDGWRIGDTLAIFCDNPLYLDSLVNSVATASGAAFLAGLAALPVAAAVWRFGWRVPLTLELFCFLPLFVPAFMLSLSLQSLLGRGGALGLLLQGTFELDPALWGLPSVVVIEAIHYFPLVLATLILTTADSSPQAHLAARLGNSWGRLTTRVFLPLGLPGAAFGMVIVFLKTLDDLATPLSLGVTHLLAPQAYFRVSTYGFQDPLSSLMAVVMIGVSAFAWMASIGFVRQHVPDTAMPPAASGRVSPRRRIAALYLAVILLFYLSCYAGMLFTSLAGIWSHTLLPESWTLLHYVSALENETGSFVNTFFYCGLAAVIDVLVGLTMALAIERCPARWSRVLSWAATGLLSIPGVTLAIAYLQFFQGMQLPFSGKSLDATAFLLPMAFSVRGLPFAIRICAFALRKLPAPCIEAAFMSGASRLRVVGRIALPMLAFGLLSACLICFGIAFADLSSTMLLLPSETGAPIAYNIYLHMQTSTGRGTGSALAFLAIVVVASTMLAAAFAARQNPAAGLKRIVLPESLAQVPH